MFRLTLGFTAAVAVTCLSAIAAEPDQPSQIIQQSQAKAEKGDGYVFYSYFTKPTFGTRDALTGVAVIEPGKEIHPPHVHAEEEYLMVVEGEGVWSLKDKDIPAKVGDILYAAPWDSHGIRNTGKVPLKFVVMKWQSKGVPVPVGPVAKSSQE